MDEASIALAGRPVVEPVDVREEHERIGVHEVRHQGGEAIVVTQANLIGGDGVVLVDDGHHAHLDESLECALGVAVVRAARHVIGGEQHLADGDVACPEGQGVLREQHALAHTRGCLLGREVARTTAEPEHGEARRDSAAGDEDDLAACAEPIGNDVDELRHALDVDPAAGLGERRRADLDDDPARLSHRPARGAGTHQSSRRLSVPRGPLAAVPPAAIVGSQSKTTAPSPGPMTTVLPGAAPSARRRSSTPSRARRSAR